MQQKRIQSFGTQRWIKAELTLEDIGMMKWPNTTNSV